MNTIQSNLISSQMQPSSTGLLANQNGSESGEETGELKDAFTRFVGQTFFGQMMKAMRQTVGKPAYFHGGQAEEAFRSQLDQTMVEHLSEASAESFAKPMFRQQFPHLVEAEAGSSSDDAASELGALDVLRRL